MTLMTTESVQDLLRPYIEELKGLYGNKLHSVVLFGSYARNEQNKDSDIDVMIFVDLTEEELIPYRKKLSNLTYDFNWDHDTDIEPIQKSISQFNYWVNTYSFYSNVRKDGITLYAAA